MRNEMPEGKDSAKKLKKTALLGDHARSAPAPVLTGWIRPLAISTNQRAGISAAGNSGRETFKISLQLHLADEMLGLGLFEAER